MKLKRKVPILYVLLGTLLMSCLLVKPIDAATVYKYKDANGRWQFTDKPPKEKKAEAQTLEFAPDAKDPFALQFHYETVDSVRHAYIVNPFFIPVEVKIKFDNKTVPEFTGVIPSNDRIVFYQERMIATQKEEAKGGEKETQTSIPRFSYRYVWGEPMSVHAYKGYRLPVSSLSQHFISQSFNGRFSHTQQPNVHSVDIALPIGTDIAAARAGTVVFVRDDYAFGGAKKYFLDKANAVYVAHDDGTYAVYAHLLMGSAVVKAGQKVGAGDVLAQSGTSGYSTGPHLHFVIRKNTGFDVQSVPFDFADERGLFTPQRKQKICPCR